MFFILLQERIQQETEIELCGLGARHYLSFLLSGACYILHTYASHSIFTKTLTPLRCCRLTIESIRGQGSAIQRCADNTRYIHILINFFAPN
ncbi:unnamed protein product [Nesidiocoris tenuis]|uniref:Uncharacterized protein n=1 Tax=Nesidiocoris tenuis TaxID=355587 RepID=A0A6H5HBF8_9HEMI|nr:unnamed protein product [Nesidiocoris tenuis]